MIQADAMYTTKDLRALGLGDMELMRARRDGVQPRKFGRWHWYSGSELVAWMSSQDRRVSDDDGGSGPPAEKDLGAGRPIFTGGRNDADLAAIRGAVGGR